MLWCGEMSTIRVDPIGDSAYAAFQVGRNGDAWIEDRRVCSMVCDAIRNLGNRWLGVSEDLPPFLGGIVDVLLELMRYFLRIPWILFGCQPV